MKPRRWIRSGLVRGLVALALGVAATPTLARQGAAPTREQADDAAAFKQFADRVLAYQKLQRAVESGLPVLKPTDVPEIITAHQEALARTIREARPHAKSGDLFTPAACEAFRHASRAALAGPDSAKSREYMQRGEANTRMPLSVNGVYPDTEPITTLPPALLAAFPPLPVEVAYRVVGRTLILMDVKSRLIVDIAERVLPPPS
jgi:hypothetical protein